MQYMPYIFSYHVSETHCFCIHSTDISAYLIHIYLPSQIPATSRISKWPYTIPITSPSSSWLLPFPFQISNIPSILWLILSLMNSKNETETREGKTHISFTESQNLFDLWRSSGPTPCLKKHHLGLIAQDHVQMAFDCFQGLRLDKLPRNFSFA